MRALIAVALAVTLIGCKQTRPAGPPDAAASQNETPERVYFAPQSALGSSTVSTTVTEGLMQPECVEYDGQADVYLVSNMNGLPTDTDDDGFISRVSPSGAITALKWIDGAAPDVTLHAPKGMALHGDTLYVVDTGAVRRFDRNTGKQLGSWELAGTTFLNDLTVDGDGNVWVSDTGVELTPAGPVPRGEMQIFKIGPDGKSQAVARGAELKGPNGMAWTPGGLVFATFTSDALMGLADGKPAPVARLPGNQLDGLVELADGTFLVTSWGAKAVFHRARDGSVRAVVQGLKAPASIGWDPKRHLILVPDVKANAVRFEHWDPAEEPPKP